MDALAEVVAESIHHVDDIVAGLLEVADNIHVVDSGLVLVVLGVYIFHVAAAEGVAVRL